MAKTKPKNTNNGCVLWIGLFVLVLLVELVVAIVQGIATVLTNIAVWVIYGSPGLPEGIARTSVYPLAWSLLGGFGAAIAAAIAVVFIEARRRAVFRLVVAAERPPKPPPH